MKAVARGVVDGADDVTEQRDGFVLGETLDQWSKHLEGTNHMRLRLTFGAFKRVGDQVNLINDLRRLEAILILMPFIVVLGPHKDPNKLPTMLPQLTLRQLQLGDLADDGLPDVFTDDRAVRIKYRQLIELATNRLGVLGISFHGFSLLGRILQTASLVPMITVTSLPRCQYNTQGATCKQLR